MTLDEYLTQNRDLPFSEACDRYAKKTGQSGHDIDEQLARDREARNEHFRRIDGHWPPKRPATPDIGYAVEYHTALNRVQELKKGQDQ